MLNGWRGIICTSWAALLIFAAWANMGHDTIAVAYDEQRQLILGISPEGWTALFTGALTISTVFLWLETRNSVRVANRALTELERPFVVFRVEDTGLFVGALGNVEPRGDGRGMLVSFLENIGRTPAVFIEHADNVLVVPRNQWPEPIDPNAVQIGLAHHTRFPSNFAIGTGQKHYLWENMARKPMEDENWNNFAENSGARGNLFVYGMLRYRDIFDAVYVMGYCAIFDVIQNRFVQMGGADLNFFRKE